MLRFTAIIALVFYISISIGVHVDVDTCCKSIAGFSMLAEASNHELAVEDDCCLLAGTGECHPTSEEAPKGCPSDCVYIQVIQDTPPPISASLDLSPIPIDLATEHILLIAPPLAEAEALEVICADPPSIAKDEQLYLQQQSLITYA